MPTSLSAYIEGESRLYLILKAILFILIIKFILTKLYKIFLKPLLQTALSTPSDTKSLLPNGVLIPCSAATKQGRRPYQEDRFDSRGNGEDLSLYGVFDGHGGQKASEFCERHLLSTILTDKRVEEDLDETLIDAFETIDKRFLETSHADGTTAVVAALTPSSITVANTGDSRAILVRKGGIPKILSQDHKPNRLDEENRIRKLGGSVRFCGIWRVEGALAVSRAIGDANLKAYVIPTPELITVERSEEDMFLVLATDGLWDVMGNAEVARFLQKDEFQQDFTLAPEALASRAIKLGSHDNVTVVIVDLRVANEAEESDGEEKKER